MSNYINTMISKGTFNGNQSYEITYIGGSVFLMAFPNRKTDALRLSRAQVDKLLSEGKINLISEKKYRDICAEILPDGSTTTHNANGTVKKAIQRTGEQLKAEHWLDDDGSRVLTAEERNARKRAESNKPKLGPEDVMGSIDEFDSRSQGGGAPQQGAPQQAMQSGKQPRSVQGGEPAQKDISVKVPERRPEPDGANAGNGADMRVQEPGADAFPPQDMQGVMGEDPGVAGAQSPSSRPLKGDLNGDGVVDEFDDIIAEEQKKNILVMIMFVGGIVASIALFFVLHAAVAGLIEGPIAALMGNPPATQEQSGDAQDGQEQEQGESVNGNGSNTVNTYKRGDFDPEDAVAAFPMADDEHEKIGVFIMQQIRAAFESAQWEADAKGGGYLANVDLDNVANELAAAYADVAAEVQGLAAFERDDLEAAWRETFKLTERQHLIDKDPYGSIFGGRVREVRQDPNDPNRIYIVCESAAGDHQRACFVANMDPATMNWKITDVMDPTGYVKMIQEGASE